MLNLIKGGVPTNLGDLLKWSYEKAAYQVDGVTNTGFYALQGGYLFQTIYDKVLPEETLEITCAYKTSREASLIGNMYLNVQYADGSTDALMLPLDYTNKAFNINQWVTTKYNYTTRKTPTVKQIDVRIVNSGSLPLHITQIAVNYSGATADSQEYKTKEFQDKCILYGYDDDKPRLR